MKKQSLSSRILCLAVLLGMVLAMTPAAVALMTRGEIPADVEKVLDDYVAENFYEGMPDAEKMDALARFPAQYDYTSDSGHSSYVVMIQTGSGNCWASTGAILALCERLGLEAFARDAEVIPGTMHANALVVAGEGDYYVLDGGYNGEAPRNYSVSRQTTLFSYSILDREEKLLTVTQYDGDLVNAKSLTIPETIDIYDWSGKRVTYTVAGIAEDFIDPTTFVLLNNIRPREVNIQEVLLPATLQQIDSRAFGNCSDLAKIVFTGDAPVISGDAFYGVTATAYYPADAQGWVADVMQNYGGTLTWVSYGGCTSHSCEEGTVIQEATCLEDGILSCKCDLCGEEYTQVIPASGKHSYSEKYTFDAATGTHWQECSVCGDRITQNCTFGEAAILQEATVYQMGIRAYSCTVCGGAVDKEAYPYRISGKNRYKTSFAAADTLKDILGVERFDTIVIACGTDFADALAGAYLACQKNAPILLADKNNLTEVADYVEQNLNADGMVYLLGGKAAIPEDLETLLADFDTKRLAGSNRYATNLKILEEAGILGDELLICTGEGFADSLSASAVNRPILLVGKKLNQEQKEFLETTSGKFVIIGGNGVVNEDIEKELEKYGTVERISGKNRYETTVRVAYRFFEAPTTAVFAYAENFPDGLCGGPLAFQLNAPMILMATGKGSVATHYAQVAELSNGVVLGGKGLISDEAVVKIIPLEAE